jgi:N-methylhydantoinase A
MIWLGIDVGGTFTDLVLYDSVSNQLTLLKTPSTPADQSEGILAGIAGLGVDPAALTRLAHGSTVATNTALERTGARLAVVATAGHRDILIVGRGERTEMYNIKARPVVPLLSRQNCFEVDERILADGSILRPLDEAAVQSAAGRIAATGAEAVAVCFINSYANPDHERRAADLLRAALPGRLVSASSDVLPEYREHARFFTTALNAYVAPRMRRYLGNLRDSLAAAHYTGDIAIMTSSGGIVPAVRIEALPALSMLSGPAAGVIGAAHIGAQSGYPDLITYDMGGTSTDVCMIHDGAWRMTNAGRVGAFPLALQQIDINTVGAGGGSIAAVGPGGVLSVGPRSAGAYPGPACYGRGGTQPTVTDANVSLGRLGTDQTLGGAIQLDADAARAAISALGAQLGLDPVTMAQGILRLSVASMASAIKEVSVMRGLDPREYALFAYGGAGPLHAADIADELAMTTVLVPPMPGNFSAFGLLVADVRRDLVRTRITPTATAEVADLRGVLQDLAASATAELHEFGFPPDRHRLQASLDMRYVGQAFELSVPVALEITDAAAIDRAFGDVYTQRYGGVADGPTEIVNFRVTAWGLTDKPVLAKPDPSGRSLAAARSGTRDVVFGGIAYKTPVLARHALPIGEAATGPAIIEEAGSSTIVPPGWRVTLDPNGILVLRRQ